ncbi:ATP-binding protein [Actinacidiphila sp. DG2A-62]|uniref:ATP-binding protein n=1 Tax=Actinacidiphila sp. DG2A-62 TaxID=3108821 RepID=UPI002DBDB61F|nr:ATP-binding protein [Actinacidiphila sp. DG2A-62]MEC3997855.1 ATP-binding protein [Actinacidiphila sp. DG2A-62]
MVKTWPPTPLSVGRARRLLAVQLAAWDLRQVVDDAELVVSELVTNAIAHAHPPVGRLIATRFERLADGVRIEVHDAGGSKPRPRRASTEEESGRGLELVDALTGGAWGVSDRDGPGKLVWAVCTVSGGEAGASRRGEAGVDGRGDVRAGGGEVRDGGRGDVRSGRRGEVGP